jgi:hypothetical protein
MVPDDLEWLEEYLTARLERQRAKSELTKKMVRQSRDLLARAYEVLALPVPVVWHPEPPQK